MSQGNLKLSDNYGKKFSQNYSQFRENGQFLFLKNPFIKFHEILGEDNYGHLLLGPKSSDSLLDLFSHSGHFGAILVINTHS